MADRVLETAEVKDMRDAWAIFRRKRAPRMIGFAIAAALAARLALGNFTWRDAVAAGLMTAVYPFGEWAIHVYLLHQPPFRYRGRRVELHTSRSHREHHEEPHRLDLINFGPAEALAILLGAAPLVIGTGAAAASLLPGPLPLGPLVTALFVSYLLIGVYEWVHFLIHTAHKPRSSAYRAIWRNHRLHHFKNEHYWHGITNTLSDRVLRTHPDQRDVERSPTARTLHRDVV
jgi:hypothetical protein